MLYESVVVIADVEEIVGLEVSFPCTSFPCETGIRQEVGLVVVHTTIEIGIGAHTVLPSASEPQIELTRKGYLKIAHEFVAKILQGVLRHNAWFLDIYLLTKVF